MFYTCCLFERYTLLKYNSVIQYNGSAFEPELRDFANLNLYNDALVTMHEAYLNQSIHEEDWANCQPIQFVHVPKTGGSSWRRTMVEACLFSGLGHHQIYCPAELGIDNNDVLSLLPEAKRKELVANSNAWLFVGDHLENNWRGYNIAFQETPFRFTIIRDPYTWFLSSYFMNHFEKKGDCYQIDFHDLPVAKKHELMRRYSNLQSKILLGLDWFFYEKTELPMEDTAKMVNQIYSDLDFIGIFESYEESAKLLKHILPNWLKFPILEDIHLNFKKRTDVQLNNQPYREMIESYFELDLALYVHSKGQLTLKLNQIASVDS